jgi:hypothetical protein
LIGLSALILQDQGLRGRCTYPTPLAWIFISFLADMMDTIPHPGPREPSAKDHFNWPVRLWTSSAHRSGASQALKSVCYPKGHLATCIIKTPWRRRGESHFPKKICPKGQSARPTHVVCALANRTPLYCQLSHQYSLCKRPLASPKAIASGWPVPSPHSHLGQFRHRLFFFSPCCQVTVDVS